MPHLSQLLCGSPTGPSTLHQAASRRLRRIEGLSLTRAITGEQVLVEGGHQLLGGRQLDQLRHKLGQLAQLGSARGGQHHGARAAGGAWQVALLGLAQLVGARAELFELIREAGDLFPEIFDVVASCSIFADGFLISMYGNV